MTVNPSLPEQTQSPSSSNRLPQPKYVVGLDLGGTNLRLLLADTNGTPIARKKGPIQNGSTPKEIVATTKLFLQDLFEEAQLPFDQLGMLGGGIPGITNCKTGVVRSASFLSEWKEVPFRALLEDELNVPVILENDANLAAYGEARAGIAQGEDDFVFLAIGTGLGAGVFLRGEIYQGANWGAGEIGYLRLGAACDTLRDADAAGPFESLVGGRGIERAWSELYMGMALSKSQSATDIFKLAKEGQPIAAKLLDRTAALVSEAIVTLMFVLDCPLIVLGGGVGTSTILHQAILNQRPFQGNFAKPRLEISQLGHDAQLIGATRLAIDKMKTL
jgi:glucokinase